MSESKAQPARDYFELFSLSLQYDIDVVELKNRYRTLQLKFHPDQYSAGASSEKMAAVKMSSLLNDAFEVLSHPVKRAQYILEKSGVDLQKDRVIDAAILMEQMELREQLETISNIVDEDIKQAQLEALHESLTMMLKNCDKQFSELARTNLEDSKVLQYLKQLLSKMLFLNKLMLELNRSIEALD